MKLSLVNLIWQRAKGRCEYCQIAQEFDELTFEIDHVVARKHRGKSIASNLALACFPCNRHRLCNLSGVDPETNSIVRLYHPRRMKWRRHFRWDGPWLVGRTPVGRATIATLNKHQRSAASSTSQRSFGQWRVSTVSRQLPRRKRRWRRFESRITIAL